MTIATLRDRAAQRGVIRQYVTRANELDGLVSEATSKGDSDRAKAMSYLRDMLRHAAAFEARPA